MRHVALLAALVVLGSVVFGATGVMAGQPTDLAASDATGVASTVGTGDGPTAEASVAYLVGTPRTNFTIALRESGDARWTVETRIPLDGEADQDAFREYAQAYETGDSDAGPSAETFRNAAASASDATGRQMGIERVNYTASLENGTGVLRLQFTWTGFLRQTDGGALVLGDAFKTPNNGTWFGSLSASQRLVIEPPANYEVSDVSQGFSYSISNRRIVANGPQQFDPDDIAVRYEPGGSGPVNGPQLSTELLVGGALLLFVVLGVLAMRRTGIGSSAPVTIPGADDDSAGNTASPANTSIDERTSSEPTGTDTTAASVERTEAADSDPQDEPATGAAAANEDEEDVTEEDLELLSDEERVERLLERNGGRMRQANIVSGTGWSDAKVSQLLSAMADEGRIEKLRLGRENLISLADDADDEDDETGDGDDAASGR
ncbi:helix-turn-helix transcriptional regulator [Halobaculum limi]|uniref:helix-turn-helix transcriptional regulator n=1 Tax=Halobaculum limi TaxID=3031916 RepID=UPI002404DD7D|nr:hypothetical protein [Halobaculum sp. YSMS11]